MGAGCPLMRLSWRYQMRTKQIHSLSSLKDLSITIHLRTIQSYLGGIKEIPEMVERTVEGVVVGRLEVDLEENLKQMVVPGVVLGQVVTGNRQAEK